MRCERKHSVHSTLIFVLFLNGTFCVTAYSITDMNRAYKELIGNYTLTNVRPLINQSESLEVVAHFHPVSLLQMDEVAQTFAINGFLRLGWTDELLKWDPATYNGVDTIYPLATDIYRPTFILMNTVLERDPLNKDIGPLWVDYTGAVFWAPGANFPAACHMNMEDFPNDVQTCRLHFIPLNRERLQVTTKGVLFDAYSPHGEWDITEASMRSELNPIGAQRKNDLVIEFIIRRRATFYHLTLLIPIIFIGLLNAFVFVIPVESGDSISYSITVVLSLTVYTGVVCELIPNSSEAMARLVHFLFISFLLAMMASIVTVIRTWVYHRTKGNQTLTKDPIDNLEPFGPWNNPKSLKFDMPSETLNKVHPLGEPTRDLAPKGISRLKQVKTTGIGGIEHGVQIDSRQRINAVDPLRPKPPIGAPDPRSGGYEVDRKLELFKTIARAIDIAGFPCFFLAYASMTLYFMFNISV